MEHDEIINTLNGLIKVCNDGMAGFQACAEYANIDSPKLKALLTGLGPECALAADTLSALVREEHGVPVAGTAVSDERYGCWPNIDTIIEGKSDRTVLEECERGEHFAKGIYQKALEKDLPQHIRLMVEQQYLGVLHNYEQIRKLLDEASESSVMENSGLNSDGGRTRISM
jgi:uncharacterized protein (TIGR02284 family)